MRPTSLLRRLADAAGTFARGVRRVLGGALRGLGAALALLLVGGAAAVGVAAGIAVLGALVVAGVVLRIAGWLAERLGDARDPIDVPGPEPITV